MAGGLALGYNFIFVGMALLLMPFLGMVVWGWRWTRRRRRAWRGLAHWTRERIRELVASFSDPEEWLFEDPGQAESPLPPAVAAKSPQKPALSAGQTLAGGPPPGPSSALPPPGPRKWHRLDPSAVRT
eukprot:8324618-Alexandrium_andersonii.AAC.1